MYDARDGQTILPALLLQNGITLPRFSVRWRSWGTLNAARDNVVLVCHHFSGNRHAAGLDEDGQPGFWDAVIGPGRAIDTERFFVVCSDTLVNLNGSGPASIDPVSGRPYRLDFPDVTIRDFVDAQRLLLRTEFGIERLHAVAGPSMGSMQALNWAAAWPEAVGRVIAAIPMGLQSDAWLIERFRQWTLPIRLDPAWHRGDYPADAPPVAGLAASLGMIVHDSRHPDGLARFGHARHADGRFLVEAAFADATAGRAVRLDANALLYLARANQRFDLLGDPAQGDARAIRCPVQFIVARSDCLLRPERARAAHDWLAGRGVTVEWTEIAGDGGHLDGLERIGDVAPAIREFLQQPG